VTRAKISQYSATAGDNTDVNGVDIAEGCPPSSMNNMGREIMAALKRFQVGSDGDGVTVGGALVVSGSTTANTFSATNVTASGNLTFTGTGRRITGDMSNATVANRVMFQSGSTNTLTRVSAIPNGTSVNTLFDAYNNSDPTNSGVMSLWANNTDMRVSSGITGTGTYLPMTFYTSGSERMRIDTSGNVGVGTSSPAAKLDVAVSSGRMFLTANGSNNAFSSVNAANNAYVAIDYLGGQQDWYYNGTLGMRLDTSGNLLVARTTNSTNNSARIAISFTQNGITFTPTANDKFPCVFENSSGTTVGYIFTTSTATTYSTSSDYRLKENIVPMTGALATVAQLKPCTYTWKSDGSDGQGFIAHELQAVIPEAVVGEKDAVDADGNPQYQGIDTSFLVATLTAAIKEQQTIIESLKSRIEALEAQA
jgi:hypothetical protein